MGDRAATDMQSNRRIRVCLLWYVRYIGGGVDILPYRSGRLKGRRCRDLMPDAAAHAVSVSQNR